MRKEQIVVNFAMGPRPGEMSFVWKKKIHSIFDDSNSLILPPAIGPSINQTEILHTPAVGQHTHAHEETKEKKPELGKNEKSCLCRFHFSFSPFIGHRVPHRTHRNNFRNETRNNSGHFCRAATSARSCTRTSLARPKHSSCAITCRIIQRLVLFPLPAKINSLAKYLN